MKVRQPDMSSERSLPRSRRLTCTRLQEVSHCIRADATLGGYFSLVRLHEPLVKSVDDEG